ncbi:TolC family protein [Candidatus Binatia bacterium]|nr:TolC family protein [Candidatus Binatia bacterium]
MILLWAALSAPAVATELPLRLTVDEAVRLAAARADPKALDLAKTQLDRSAAWLPGNPYLSGGGGSTSIAGIAPSQFIFLSQEFEIAGQREQRMAAATHGVQEEQWDLKSSVLNLGAKARALFVTAILNRDRLALAREDLEAAQRLVRNLPAPATTSDRIEQNSALMQESRARLAVDAARHASEDSLDALRALCGLPNTQALQLEGTVEPHIAPVATVETLVERAQQRRPDFVARTHAAKRTAHELELARRERIPNVNLGTGVTRYQDGETVWAGDIGLSLPVFQTGGPAVQDALAESNEARRELADLEAMIAREVHDAYRSLTVNTASLRAYMDDLVPRSEENLRLERRLLDEGEVTVSDLIGLEIDLLVARRGYLDALENYHLSLIDLERVTAGSIEP